MSATHDDPASAAASQSSSTRKHPRDSQEEVQRTAVAPTQTTKYESTNGLKIRTVKVLLEKAVSEFPKARMMVEQHRPSMYVGLSDENIRAALRQITGKYPEVRDDVAKAKRRAAAAYDFKVELEQIEDIWFGLEDTGSAASRKGRKDEAVKGITKALEGIVEYAKPFVYTREHLGLGVSETHKNAASTLHAIIKIMQNADTKDAESVRKKAIQALLDACADVIHRLSPPVFEMYDTQDEETEELSASLSAAYFDFAFTVLGEKEARATLTRQSNRRSEASNMELVDEHMRETGDDLDWIDRFGY